MKITHKEFLAEQAKLGKKIPKIFEDVSNTVAKKPMNISVDFEGDFEGDEESQINGAAGWKFYPVEPVKIISAEGNVSDERTNLDIELSNGDKIAFTCFYSVGPTDPKNVQEFAKLSVNNVSHDVKELYMEHLANWNNVIVAVLKCYENIILKTNEGFFGDLKNKVMGTIEYNTGNSYTGSSEAQAFVAKDRRSKVQIDTLMKKGMTAEEAKSAVMYVFDKSGKNPLGFMGKKTEYDTQTKTLKVTTSGGSNPSLMA